MSTTCLHCGNPTQSQRSTKKYCSDNCKQLAFYKRSRFALASLNKGETVNSQIQTENYDEPIRESVFAQPPINLQTVPDDCSAITPTRLREEPAYEWVHSKMVNSIAEYIDSSEDLFMFQHPLKYWGVHVLPAVKWTSTRLRCLIETLITLSSMPAIDNHSIVTVKDAFASLVSSIHFKRLPDNYPYRSLIKELEQKITLIVKQHKHAKSIQFRLTSSRKAELIAIRYILADFVPASKFSEMDFNE